MATSTQIWTSFQDVVKNLVIYTQAYSANILTQNNTTNQNYVGKYASQLASRLATYRDDYGNALSRFAAILRLLFYDMAAATDVDLGASVSNFNDIVAQFNKWMVDNSVAIVEQVQSTSVGSVTGSGTGVIDIVSVDKYDNKIQNIFPGSPELRCINDQTMNVTTGNEVFQVIPEDQGSNSVDSYGTGRYTIGQLVRSIDPVTTNFINNGFWNSSSVSAPTVTSISPWTFTNGAETDLAASTSLLWRSTQTQSMLFNSVSGGAKQITITQDITKTLNELQPYSGYIVYRNETNGGTADLTFTIGSKSTTVNLPDVSGTPGSITVLKWKLDTDSWLANFKPAAAADVTCIVDVDLVGAGTVAGSGVRIYGIFWNSMGFLGRCPFLMSAGATDWTLDDYFTFTNTYTAAGAGKIQQALRDQLGIYLYSDSGATTVIADPT